MNYFRLKLKNQFECDIMTEILDDYNIAYALIKNYSVVYNGIFENQFGWGYLEIEKKYKDKVEKLYNEFKENNQEPIDD